MIAAIAAAFAHLTAATVCGFLHHCGSTLSIEQVNLYHYCRKLEAHEARKGTSPLAVVIVLAMRLRSTMRRRNAPTAHTKSSKELHALKQRA